MGAPEGCKATQCSPQAQEGTCSGWWVSWEQSGLPGLRFPPPWQEERSAIARAQHFLESSMALASDPYVSALSAYTLTLLRSPAAPAALRKLRSLAIVQGRCPPPATPAATGCQSPQLQNARPPCLESLSC